MKNQKIHWNRYYLNKQGDLTEYQYDAWLEKYKRLLKGKKVIDLGCGIGNDSKMLVEQGVQVHACDFSQEALKILQQNLPTVPCTCIDMTKKFPFEDGCFDVVVADLSLHYFTWEVTVGIVAEIARILTIGGSLLLRVNSMNDVAYGAGQGIELEQHLYLVQEKMKRFFKKEDLLKLFVDWKIKYIEEYTNWRFEYGKVMWEVCCLKNNL